MELSVCRGLGAPGQGTDLLSSGQECPAVLGPPGLCLSQESAGSWAVSLAPWVPDLRCWIGNPGAAEPPPRGAAIRTPPSCSRDPTAPSGWRLFLCQSCLQAVPGRAAPFSWSHHLCPSELFLELHSTLHVEPLLELL